MSTMMKCLLMASLCCICNMGSHAEQADSGGNPSPKGETSVTIELVKLETTESSFGLTYVIQNKSDHSVWICSQAGPAPFEMFLAHDKQTLVIRKRLDVPSNVVWRSPPTPGTYICLNPGGHYEETLLIDMPVTPRFVYATGDTRVDQTVRHLRLEIGFYDEDLPGLVRGIRELAGAFASDAQYLHPDIQMVYFRGLSVRRALAGFDVVNRDPYGDGRVNIAYSYQALTGERVLPLEVKGVAIPYSGGFEKEEASKFPLIVNDQ